MHLLDALGLLTAFSTKHHAFSFKRSSFIAADDTLISARQRMEAGSLTRSLSGSILATDIGPIDVFITWYKSNQGSETKRLETDDGSATKSDLRKKAGVLLDTFFCTG